MAMSKIEWTQATWNPTTGCTKVSPGCKNCYAERMSIRLQAMGIEKYANGFELTVHNDALEIPYQWKKPKLIFVNSMSDLFHEQMPKEYIFKVINVMHEASWHQYQILTKRSENLLRLDPYIDWPDNAWMGVSVENDRYSYRIDHLRKTGAKIKFLSLEPLLGPLPDLDLRDIDWVIVGGESGPRARPMHYEWVTEIKNQCHDADIPFFFKQWGGANKRQKGRLLEGTTWDEMPKFEFEVSG
jgi:protein gp37